MELKKGYFVCPFVQLYTCNDVHIRSKVYLLSSIKAYKLPGVGRIFPMMDMFLEKELIKVHCHAKFNYLVCLFISEKRTSHDTFLKLRKLTSCMKVEDAFKILGFINYSNSYHGVMLRNF